MFVQMTLHVTLARRRIDLEESSTRHSRLLDRAQRPRSAGTPRTTEHRGVLRVVVVPTDPAERRERAPLVVETTTTTSNSRYDDAESEDDKS